MFICKNCGKEFEESSINSSNYCSSNCYEKYQKYNRTSNCECIVCKKKMYLKPYRLKRLKNGICCSKECHTIFKKTYCFGKKNHQYGLKGPLNSSFIDKKIITNYGYFQIYLPEHPFSNKNGRFWEHRYIIEQYSDYNDSYFEIINGYKVLKKNFHVHHINENKLDNRIENLTVFTKSQHQKLHSKQNLIIRDKINGRIVGVVKKDEFRGSLEEDNPEPSIENEFISINEGAEHSN